MISNDTVQVKKTTSTSSTPVITGTCLFTRLTNIPKPTPLRDMIIVINYNYYRLFDGYLTLDEKSNPYNWKIKIPANRALSIGSYDVRTILLDIQSNKIIFDKVYEDYLSITQDTTATSSSGTGSGSGNSIQSLMSQMGGLMNMMNQLGQKQGVHPTTDDDSSTNLKDRDKQEADQDSHRQDDKKQHDNSSKNEIPKANLQDVTATSGHAGDAADQNGQPQSNPTATQGADEKGFIDMAAAMDGNIAKMQQTFIDNTISFAPNVQQTFIDNTISFAPNVSFLSNLPNFDIGK